MLSDSPIYIKKDITIHKKITLTIDPGVKVILSPKVRILVIGKLIARGSSNQRIIFTKINNQNVITNSTIRLVGGEEFREGKIQILYDNKWRPICSQNREWKQNDIQVACREMGYQFGNFSLNDRAENYTSHVLLQQPNCNGSETTLSDCVGFKNVEIGSSVCNLQELVGLHCWGANNRLFNDNWWGINLYNSTMREDILSAENTRLNVSASVLTYVDILYGGVNSTNHRVSALSASPYPPRIEHVRMAYNAYDALNFTDILGPVFITDTTFEHNQGHAINITSQIGYIELNNVNSKNNIGSGGYIRLTTKHWTEVTSELVDLSKNICGQSVITSSPIFPFLVVLEHPVPTFGGEDICSLPINTDKTNQIISVKLLEVIRDPTASAIVKIIDVSTDKILALWNFTTTPEELAQSKAGSNKLIYGPLYQGVSSFAQSIKIVYTWKKDFNQKICPYLHQCFRSILQISVGESTNPEVLVTNSHFTDNIQQGLRIENLGLYARIMNSQFHNNQYAGGLHLVNGSFDVLVHNCVFTNNDRTGLNITTAGGYRIVNKTSFIGNQGHGLDIWNPTWLMTRMNKGEINNIVYLSTFKDNLWNGIRFYNSTNQMNILVNYSSFTNNAKYGIEVMSTLINQNKLLTNFSVGFSEFVNNKWHSISMAPMGQMTGNIFNNTFIQHISSGAISIDNGINFQEQRLLYQQLPVNYFIHYNTFSSNGGQSPFVISVRLSENSAAQHCFVGYNKILNNRIVSVYQGNSKLNDRSSMPAVIVVGSSNVVVARNFISNPESTYDISAQIQASDVKINATANYWAIQSAVRPQSWEKIHELIFNRLFDRNNRYSLAEIEYFPVLKEENLRSNIFSDNDPKYRPKFRKSQTEIGGLIDLNREQIVRLEYQSQVYHVTNDMYIPFGAVLNIDAGVQLQFENSVGMFVQGTVTIIGNPSQPIKMFTRSKLSKPNTISAHVQLLTKQQLVDSSYNISLINGTLTNYSSNSIQGLVRVNVGGVWSTICDNEFDIVAARIICTQLGLVVHPSDWQISPNEKLSNLLNDSINISTLRCQKWHTDINQCEFDTLSEHKCSITNSGVVNLRCHQPGWTGIKFSLTNEKSTLNYVDLERAGLLDYYDNLYQPSLQFDYNKHDLGFIKIHESLSDGLLINHNDILNNNKLSNIQSINNLGNGIVLRTPWIDLTNCHLEGNKLAGFQFDPSMSEEELFQFRSSMIKTQSMVNSSSDTIKLGMHQTGFEVLYMPRGTKNEIKTYWIELVATDPNNQHQLMVSLFDFNPDTTRESVIFYDDPIDKVKRQFNSNPSVVGSITYSIPKDLTRFPFLSNGRAVTIQVVVNGTLSGRLALLVQSRSFRDMWSKEKRVHTTANSMLFYPPTFMSLNNSNITQNRNGLSITHYNTGSDSQNRSYTMRQSRLYISITNNLFLNNTDYAIKIPSVSPFKMDFYFPTYGDDFSSIESNSRISRIFYKIIDNRFLNNNGLMLADHNHVPYSSNVWEYSMTKNLFKFNRNGEILIQLPFVSKKFDWRFIKDIDHFFEIFENQFLDNINFRLDIGGYYLKLNITSNKFVNNICLNHGLISLNGMEKRFNMTQNDIINNTNCKFIFELDSFSQSELADKIIGQISENKLVDNGCNLNLNDRNSINCYSVGVFGNQDVVINRNLLNNKDKFKYELVAGLISNNLKTKFDARYNYWGTVDLNKIRQLIFDVNNWNNFAEVNFHNFLLTNSLTKTNNYYTGKIPTVEFNLNGTNRVGGRIESNLFLKYRRDGYVIDNDITIMPGIEMRIDPGVELRFQPNVGILVLGKLIAKGTQYKPIVMRPAQRPSDNLLRVRRSVATVKKSIRFIGGNNSNENEGFLQFFNTTAMRWDYICDDQFSIDVARVACHEMGYRPNNVLVARSYLIDHQLYGYENPFIVKYVWTTRYICRGHESRLDECVKRLNYDFFKCSQRRDFVFLRCGKDHLTVNESYWGNIRVVNPDFELGNQIKSESSPSILEHIQIIKAGILHGELVSAIQTTHSAPQINYLTITKCAWNGIDVIMPRNSPVHISNCTISDNAGYGSGLTILNTDAGTIDPRTTNKQTQLPLHLSPLPSSILGLLDMCDIDKDIELKDRVLIYYRYSYRTIACTKLIKSQIPNKRIAIRFLQLNLYYDPFTKNTIELYNGDAFNATEQLGRIDAVPIKNLDYNGFLTSPVLPSYVTKMGYDRLGIHLHASPAGNENGFILELITLPISPDATYPHTRDMSSEHKITESNFLRNQRGSIRVSVVGESQLAVSVYYNRLVDNGAAPMLNLTSDPVILMRLHNCRDAGISNNMVEGNRGGTELHLYTSSLNSAVRINVTNNAFVKNNHGNVLKIIGKYLCTGNIQRNFIANNDCENRDVIKVHGVLMKPFSHNYLTNNRGSVIVNASGSDDLSSESTYEWNGFYDNWSVNFTRSATIYCDNSKNRFQYNYFRNLRNNYELAVGNRSIMKEEPILGGNNCPESDECRNGWTLMLERDSCVCYRPDKLYAQNNWWGEEMEFYLRGKIWDQTNDKYLITVDTTNALKSNKTVLDGSLYCPPTWQFVNGNCYFYLGAPVNYEDSKLFCHQQAGSILANTQIRVDWINTIVRNWQNNYDWINMYSYNTRTWVHSHVPFTNKCPTVKHQWLEGFECDRPTSFLCQKSPYGVYSGIQIEFLISMIVIGLIFLIIIILLVLLWRKNSIRRHKAFLLRCDNLKTTSSSPLPLPVWGNNGESGYANVPRTGSTIGYAPTSSRTTETIASSSGRQPLLGVASLARSNFTSNSGRSKYDNDVIQMRRNTLTDTKETIYRPKTPVEDQHYRPMTVVEAPTRLQNPNTKKLQYIPKKYGGPNNRSTLNSKISNAASMEALYANVPPGSQMKLSQPDVPRLFDASSNIDPVRNRTLSKSSLVMPSHNDRIIDSLHDPYLSSRNKPVIIRNQHEMPSVSQRNSVDDNKSSSSSSFINYNPRDSAQIVKPINTPPGAISGKSNKNKEPLKKKKKFKGISKKPPPQLKTDDSYVHSGLISSESEI